MSGPDFIVKNGIAFIAAAFALSGITGFAHAAPPGMINHDGANRGITSPSRQEAPAQPALPVITVSEAQATDTSASGATADNEFSADQILGGNERGVVSPGPKVLRSQAELEALLQQIYSGQTPPEAPPIDFSRQVLVYYSLGTGMHGNDNIYIRRGSLEHGVLHVYVEIAHSNGNCLTTRSLTAPFAIAALPFPAREVQRAEFDISHQGYPCT